MKYLEKEQNRTLENLLSRVTAVCTNGDAMTMKWFEILLKNSKRTLKLGVKGDSLSHVYHIVQNVMKRKQIEELVLYINDVEISFQQLNDLLMALLHNPIILLQIKAYKVSLCNYRSQIEHFKTFTASLHLLIKLPTLQCLKFCGVLTTTAAKSLILTYLSTPCSSPQTLEIDGMYEDSDGVGATVSSMEQQIVQSTGEFYHLKSLIVDSIDLDDAKALRMHKYLSSNESKVIQCYGSISSWILCETGLKIGSLELRDYDYNCAKIIIPSTVCVKRMKMFCVNRTNCSDQWKSSLFLTAFTNPSLQELTWHARHTIQKRLSDPKAYYASGLSASLLGEVPGECLKKVRITISYWRPEDLNLTSIVEAVATAFPHLQFSCDVDLWSKPVRYRTKCGF